MDDERVYLWSKCRPRKGAWIEILAIQSAVATAVGRPRKGAWIEIRSFPGTAPWGTCRPRKGAWIEIIEGTMVLHKVESPPQGGVD